MTWTAVTSLAELDALVGEPTAAARDKVRTRLSDVDRGWLAASPLCLLATASADGACDVSPRGDPTGAVHVLDDATVVVPDRPGNRRVDSWRNLLENSHVGLLSLLPGRGDTLRVNGRARLVSDAPFFDDLVVRGHRPVLALVVDVEEVFFHCSKAFLRSALWDPSTWHPDVVASRARIAQALERPESTVEELEAYYGPSYTERLYQG